MNQVLSGGLAYTLVYHLIGDQKINNSISKFSDDHVKLHMTNRQRRKTCDRVLQIGEVKIILIMELKQCGKKISNDMM